MTKRWICLLAASALAFGTLACYPYYSGERYFPRAPRFEPTHPDHVRLLRYAPRRPHIQLGEVWIRPEPGMSRRYVENSLRARGAALGADAVVIVEDRYFNRYVARYSWYGRRYYRERVIVGIAIRYR